MVQPTHSIAHEHHTTLRILSIFDELAQAPDGLTLTELSELLAVSKSTISPMLRTMEKKNYLARDLETNKYSIGLKISLIGKAFDRNNLILNILHEAMLTVVDTTKETCQVGILEGNQVLYIAKVDSPEPIRLFSDVGKTFPVYCTAIGKSLISAMSEKSIHTLISEPIKPITPHTIRSLSTLLKQLEEIRKTGIAWDHEEVTPGVDCVSVPIKVHEHIAYGMSITTPSYRFTDTKRKLAVDALKKAKLSLEERLSS
jgi:IclR family KDG regulon transcriptional repressor